MKEDNLIPLDQICSNYKVELSFFHSLDEYGLIDIIEVENTSFIDSDNLGQLEKIMHLYYDLEINFQGIDAIKHLLEKMERMQKELNELRNKII